MPGHGTCSCSPRPGPRAGKPRETLLGSFPDGDGAWLITASVGGVAQTRPGTTTSPRTPDQAADRDRQQEGQGDGDPARRRGTGGGLAADHRGSSLLRRVREEDRPGNSRHPPRIRRLKTIDCGISLQTRVRITIGGQFARRVIPARWRYQGCEFPGYPAPVWEEV